MLEGGLAPAASDFAFNLSGGLGEIEYALVDQLVDRSNDRLQICRALRKGHVSTAEVASIVVDEVDHVLSIRPVGNQYTDQLRLHLPDPGVTCTKNA